MSIDASSLYSDLAGTQTILSVKSYVRHKR